MIQFYYFLSLYAYFAHIDATSTSRRSKKYMALITRSDMCLLLSLVTITCDFAQCHDRRSRMGAIKHSWSYKPRAYVSTILSQERPTIVKSFPSNSLDYLLSLFYCRIATVVLYSACYGSQLSGNCFCSLPRSRLCAVSNTCDCNTGIRHMPTY